MMLLLQETNGEEALDLFLKRSFDIVFTALKMPGMDGLTLSLQVKATSLNTPVVLMLDENTENAMSRIKAGRIDCVMSKPLGSGEIQKVMQYFLGKRVMTYENYDRVRGTGSNSTGRAPIRHISLFDNYRHANHGI